MVQGISSSYTVQGGSSTKYMSFRMKYSQKYDISRNVSIIELTPQIRADWPNGWYGYNYYPDGYADIDGKRVKTFTSSGESTNPVDVKSQGEYYSVSGSPFTSFEIPHNADGTKSIKISFDISIYTAYGDGGNGARFQGATNVTLTTIPRAATIGASSANIEETSTISVNRASTSFSYSLAYKFGSLSGFINSNGNATSSEVKLSSPSMFFNIPASFYNQIPNSKSGTCTLTCRTYSGNTLIGSPTTATFTAIASENRCKPNVSGSVSDINPVTTALTGDSDKLVRYVSTAKCTISASAKNGSTIKKLYVNGAEIKNGNTIEFQKAIYSGYDFVAEDSRGYRNSYKIYKGLIPYIELTNNSYVKRTDPTSGNAIIVFRGTYFPGSFGKEANTLSASYKVNSGSSVSVITQFGENSYYFEVPISGYDYMKQYDFDITVSDKISVKTVKYTLRRGIPVFDWGESDFSFNVPISCSNNFQVAPETPGMFGQWGFVWSKLGNTYGKSQEDNYYIAVDINGKVHSGIQKSGNTSIVWK